MEEKQKKIVLIGRNRVGKSQLIATASQGAKEKYDFVEKGYFQSVDDENNRGGESSRAERKGAHAVIVVENACNLFYYTEREPQQQQTWWEWLASWFVSSPPFRPRLPPHHREGYIDLLSSLYNELRANESRQSRVWVVVTKLDFFRDGHRGFMRAFLSRRGINLDRLIFIAKDDYGNYTPESLRAIKHMMESIDSQQQ